MAEFSVPKLSYMFNFHLFYGVQMIEIIRMLKKKYLFCDTSHGLNDKSNDIGTANATKCSIH
jgi:hypothetical protein